MPCFLLESPAEEIYIPAQHDSNSLAKAVLDLAGTWCVPFAVLLEDQVVGFRSGLLIVDVDDRLQACYDSHRTKAYPVLDHSLSAAWRLCVERAMVSNRALVAVYWLRVAPCCHISPDPDFSCPFCFQKCRGWGIHVWYRCVPAPLAAMHGFQVLLKCLHAEVKGMELSGIPLFLPGS